MKPSIGQELPLATQDGLRLVEQGCCVCLAKDGRPIATGLDFEYRSSADNFVAYRCARCHLVFLNPRPANSELERIYPPTYHAFQFSVENFGIAYRIRSLLETRRLLACCKGLPLGARILDVGCGDGFHLKLLAESGHPSWRLEGIDASPKAVAAAIRSNLNVRACSIESEDVPQDTFDLIFLIATIEHVPDPRALLAGVLRALRRGGRLVIVTDNTATLDFNIFGGRHWGGYHFPRHWNLFTRHNLSRLGTSLGFEIVKMETIFSPVNWVYSIRNLLQDRGCPSWLYEKFSLSSPLPLAVFTIVDTVFRILDRGALLRATFRRPS